MMATDARAGATIAVGWLEERWHVDGCHFVKTVGVCRSIGSSELTVDSQKSYRVEVLRWGKCERKLS